MGYVYFFTGFPGFIANQLISRLMKEPEDVQTIYALTLPGMQSRAEEVKQQLVIQYNFPEEKLQLVTGDITKAQIALDSATQNQLVKTVTHVYHLAAIYDLAVPRDIAYEVNVKGTANVNEWVKEFKNLKRYTYFSTAYVAGRREGLLLEKELIRPDSFKNYYEETKYEAEVLVEQLKNHIPVTIIRPGIVKGHSETGETVKFDGPYMILNMLDRLRKSPFFPYIGSGVSAVNLVPIDFIVEAVHYLSHASVGEGKTYHLTDPNPYPARDLYEMFLKEMIGKKPKGRLPISVVKALLGASNVRKSLRVEKEVIDYFTWQAKFDCQQATEDLKAAGISCPDFQKQVPAMVRFYLENKDNKNYHITIK